MSSKHAVNGCEMRSVTVTLWSGRLIHCVGVLNCLSAECYVAGNTYCL